MRILGRLLRVGCAGLTISLCLTSGMLHAAPPAAVPDFTFIQASDVHAPMPQSQATLAKIPGLGEINLEPFNVKVAKPGFAIVTGDLNEFGGGNGGWETYLSYWKGCNLPVYPVLGNHDNTWHANLKALREAGFGPGYSFDRQGCHFVGLMTATLQDPRPSVGEEEILWLKKDLEKVGVNTPVFVFFHHPLGGTEFASRYDWERLMDVLRGCNTVLLMAGHSHGHVYRSIEGMDQITGGSTFGPDAGFAVISIKDGVLRAAYWKVAQPAPDLKLIEKPVPAEAPRARVEIASPGFRELSGAALSITASLAGPAEVEKATYSVDDEMNGTLSLTGKQPEWKASGAADVSRMLPGAHYLRIEFEKGDQRYSRSTEFFLQPTNDPTAWRAYLAASSKVTPAIASGAIYVGANDGNLRAFDAKTGKELWSAATGAEILAEPLVEGDNVVTANGLGIVSAYTRAGRKVWSFTAGDAVYSSPVTAAGRIIFGCNDGKLYALETATGKRAWVNEDGTYTIESKPFVWNGKVYYGAWDEYIRCVDAKDGKLIWKQRCEGARLARAAKRYYSPADAMPVVVEGRLMIADRSYTLTILNADTGEVVGAIPRVAATGRSEDGKFAYLRKTDGQLAKIDSLGKELWSVGAHLGAIPTAPAEKKGVVYVSSGTGTVSAISASNGEILWQYQASPRLYVMSSVACDEAKVYLTAFDGTLTAIRTDFKR